MSRAPDQELTFQIYIFTENQLQVQLRSQHLACDIRTQDSKLNIRSGNDEQVNRFGVFSTKQLLFFFFFIGDFFVTYM